MNAALAVADELSTLEKLVSTTGPLGAAIVLLVLAIICVWKYAARPFLIELQPISTNLKDTAASNKDASAGFQEAAKASKEAAEAWQETARASSQHRH